MGFVGRAVDAERSAEFVALGFPVSKLFVVESGQCTAQKSHSDRPPLVSKYLYICQAGCVIHRYMDHLVAIHR